ncbi:MAG: mechanosensitive ion channel [Mucilaginibacter sp.]|nr:mechanosensitive ion channel [Mucilaginibacter sp.]
MYKFTFLLILTGLLITSGVMSAFAQTPGKIVLKNDSGQSIPDTLLFKLQKAQAAIIEINASNQRGYGSAEVRADLTDIRNDIAPIKADLRFPHKTIDPKTLVSYNLILNNSEEKLLNWQKSLSKVSNDLQRMSKEVVELSSDTLLSVSTNDTTGKQLYTGQLIDTKLKLQAAGKANSASLDTVSRLLAAVSAVYLDVTGLEANISERLEASGKSIVGKESPYIWDAPQVSRQESVGTLLASSYAGQQKILGYFLSSSWENRILLLIFGAFFFLWVYFNFQKADKLTARGNMSMPEFVYLNRNPVIPAMVVLLNVAPLFEPDAPSPYIELIQFLSVAVITILFRRKLSPDQYRYWLYIVILYLAIVVAGAAVHEALFMRLFLITINAVSLYIGFRLIIQIKKARIAGKFVRPVVIIYELLNAAAILLNMFGRVSLAKIYSLAAIVGLTQIIGLAVFIQVFSNALELQIKVSACTKGFFSRISINKTRVSFRRALSVVSVLLWLLVFLINLSIAGGVFEFIHQVLVKRHSFGSVTFTLGNVLFFAMILFVSHLLQKHIGIVFGEKSVTFSDHVEHKGSKLTLLRLLVAVIGILLAVTASGIPLDKLTVVLGALSVGIGLGMQNIVNNFVSGIILIFEKPFQIGDFVELADKKGKIQDIGIRASKMLTQQGSEVIIPNGDLISNRFTNWTINSAWVQSEILFKVVMASDLNVVYKIIDDAILSSENVIKQQDKEIFINSISADAVELRILIWVESIYVEADFKSQLFSKLISEFNKAQIKLV